MGRSGIARSHSRHIRPDPPHHARALSTNSASIHLAQVRFHGAVHVERSRVHVLHAVCDGGGGLASLPRLCWMGHDSYEPRRAASRQLAAGRAPERPRRARAQWWTAPTERARARAHGGSVRPSTPHHGPSRAHPAH